MLCEGPSCLRDQWCSGATNQISCAMSSSSESERTALRRSSSEMAAASSKGRSLHVLSEWCCRPSIILMVRHDRKSLKEQLCLRSLCVLCLCETLISRNGVSSTPVGLEHGEELAQKMEPVDRWHLKGSGEIKRDTTSKIVLMELFASGCTCICINRLVNLPHSCIGHRQQNHTQRYCRESLRHPQSVLLLLLHLQPLQHPQSVWLAPVINTSQSSWVANWNFLAVADLIRLWDKCSCISLCLTSGR